MTQILPRKIKWFTLRNTLGISTIIGGSYYYFHQQKKIKQADINVIHGQQVLWNASSFRWEQIPPCMAQRYLPPYEEPGILWRIGSSLSIGITGLVGKGVVSYLENTKVYGMDQFLYILNNNNRQQGIITVSNHFSVWDDPVLWGVFPVKALFNIDKMRWVLGAADICYTTLFKSIFFSLGQAIPTIRGAGIYQPALDFAIYKLNHKGWIHIFPEGKVNQTDYMLRFKWGIGRLIMESDPSPIVIPIWHEGMENVRPLQGPFMKLGQQVKMIFGEPIDCQPILDAWKQGLLTEEETRIQLTSLMYQSLEDIKQIEKLKQKSNI
ncbi:unnamed protein product [Cunninghamella echinulata]